jgi:hypothetical protein
MLFDGSGSSRILETTHVRGRPCGIGPWRRMLLVSIVSGFFALQLFPVAAQATWTYRDRTGRTESRIEIRVETIDGGRIIQLALSDGDSYHVRLNATGETVRYDFVSPSRRTAYAAIRAGDAILFQGTLDGTPLSRSVRINAKPWYQSMEWSLQPYALSGSSQALVFWVVQPFEAQAYLMQARGEKPETVRVDDHAEYAIRVKVSPSGALASFWSELFWYRPTDGLYLRNEAVRGATGTPKSTVELIEEK